MTKKRVESIDIAKGIGILLVILGHLTVDGQMVRFVIFTFHMPLFFMLSGVFADKKQNLADGAAKLVRTLLVPYLFVVVCDFAWLSILALKDGKLDFGGQLKHMLLCAAGLDKTYNSAVWFLFALFIIKAAFLLINQIESKVAKEGVVLAISAIGIAFILTRRFFEIGERYLYLSALGCFVFYSAGYFLRDIILNLENSVQKNKIHLALAPVSLGVVVLIAQIKQMFIVHVYRYTDHPLLMLVAAVCGTYATVVLSAFIATSLKAERLKKALIFFGKNSIVILMIHYPIARKFYPYVFGLFGIKEYVNRPLAEAALFVLTTLLMIPAIYLFNKYLYYIIGKKKPTRT